MEEKHVKLLVQILPRPEWLCRNWSAVGCWSTSSATCASFGQSPRRCRSRTKWPRTDPAKV